MMTTHMRQRNINIKRKYESGMDKLAIGQEEGLSRERVRQILLEMDADTAMHLSNRKPARLQQARDLQAQGLHQSAIVREVGVSRSTIRDWIRKGLMDKPKPWTPPHNTRAANIYDDYHHAGVPVADLRIMYGVSRVTVYHAINEPQSDLC